MIENARSSLRAWVALVGIAVRRQVRVRQMTWIALGLLALTAGVVAIVSADNGWSIARWRYPRRVGPNLTTLSEYYHAESGALPFAPMTGAMHTMGAGTLTALVASSPFGRFARWCVFGLFVSFLLPLWSLSFATEAIGGERESRTLLWLLTRPMPRPAIYLAKFVALLPWIIGLNLGGFLVICLAAGAPGRTTFQLFWPAVLMGSLAFVSLFHFIAAWARRPTVVSLIYAFFLEILLGDMPGLMKRVSISFYVRSMMFDAAREYGLSPDKPYIYQPVDGATAFAVLLCATVGFLLAGMFVFSRREYPEET